MILLKNRINKYRELLGQQLFYSKERVEKLHQLRGIHAGERCFVIGNGPSLNRQDLEKLGGDLTFVTNAFFLAYDKISWRPDYYTVEDAFPAKDNREQLNAMDDTTKIIPYDLRQVLTSDPHTIYIPFFRYYMFHADARFPLFSGDISKAVYWGGTVLYMNLQLAAWMGFSEVFLIGVDLTYKIPASVEQQGNDLTSTEDDPNHFHPAYFGKGKQWHLPEVDRMQRSFSSAYHQMSKLGVSLYNATDGGNLQEIPRADYDSLF